MYCQHFDLKRKPFSISPDERFLWLGEKHLKALSTLQYAIQENKGFLALTGDIGAGKTALIYRLIKTLPKNVIVATISNPDLKFSDFYKVLAKKFNIKQPVNGKAGFLLLFKQFLKDAYKADKSVLLIIDEAHQLNFKLLDEILMLSNLVQDHHRLLNIFFIGQSEFYSILLDERGKSVRQRISVKYHIKALDAQETTEYIRYRLKIAKGNQEIFLPEAVKIIHRFSKGNPRMINLICDQALLTGYLKGSNYIDGAISKECARELDISKRIEKGAYKNKLEKSEPSAPVHRTRKPSPSNRPFFVAIITGSAALCLLALFIFGLKKSLMMTTDRVVKVDSFKKSNATKNADSQDKEKTIEALMPTPEIKEQALNSAPTLRSNSIAIQKTLSKEQTQDPYKEWDKAHNQLVYGAASIPEKELIKVKFAESEPALTYTDLKDLDFLVSFKGTSMELKDDTFIVLNKVANLMNKHPAAEIILVKYRKPIIDSGYTKKRTELRINSIKSFFTGRGFDAEKLIVLEEELILNQHLDRFAGINDASIPIQIRVRLTQSSVDSD
jgi:general secretion pathway protein A